MSRKILLTISLLISNRPDTVRKCLDSIKPLREEVPSELILVDTGCGEQVRGIIEEYTNKIVDFEWCQDFSKARNAGLKKAKGEWFLFLDDDEWFEDVTEIIDFFKSGEYRKYGLGAYVQRNYLESEGKVYNDLLVGRMVRLEPDIKFVYSIHENFNRVPGKVKKFSAYVHHFGYTYKSPEEARAHSERNISLLLKEHERTPWNMKHTLQLAQEYNALSEFDKSIEMSLDGIGWFKKGRIEDDFCLYSLFSNEIDCYIQLKRYDDTIEKGEKYLREEKLDPLVRSVIEGDLGIAYIEKKDYESCLKNVRLYWDEYQKYIGNETAYIEYITIMTNECFEPRNRSVVLGNGIRAAVNTGQGELAWKWFQALEWKGTAIFVSNEMICAIIKRMPDAEAAEELPYYVKMCNTILQRKEMEGYLVNNILKTSSEHENRAEATASYAGVGSEHWFFRLADILAAARKRKELTAQEAEDLALRVLEKMESSASMMKECNLPEALESIGVNLGQVLEKLPFQVWKSGISYLYASVDGEELEWWNECFSDALPADALRMLVWRAFYSTYCVKRIAGIQTNEKDYFVQGDEDGIIRDMEEQFREYAECLINFCGRVYLPEVISQQPDMLPTEYQAAYHMADMLDGMESGRYDKAVKAIKEICRLLPGLDKVMKRYLKWLNGLMEKQKQEAKQAEGEMQVLTRQIKTKVRGMIEAGQGQAALQVVNQLEALLPGDEEVRRWKEQLSQS